MLSGCRPQLICFPLCYLTPPEPLCAPPSPSVLGLPEPLTWAAGHDRHRLTRDTGAGHWLPGQGQPLSASGNVLLRNRSFIFQAGTSFFLVPLWMPLLLGLSLWSPAPDSQHEGHTATRRPTHQLLLCPLLLGAAATCKPSGPPCFALKKIFFPIFPTCTILLLSYWRIL